MGSLRERQIRGKSEHRKIKRIPYEGEKEDWSDASQRMPRNAHIYQKLGENHEKDSSSKN